MKKMILAFAAVAIMAFASVAGASADGPVTDEIRPAEFHVWLEGITADDKIIIGARLFR